MKLKDWRHLQRLTQDELAQKIGERISPTHVHYWENGTMPRKETREVILKLTRGAVTANDFS